MQFRSKSSGSDEMDIDVGSDVAGDEGFGFLFGGGSLPLAAVGDLALEDIRVNFVD